MGSCWKWRMSSSFFILEFDNSIFLKKLSVGSLAEVSKKSNVSGGTILHIPFQHVGSHHFPYIESTNKQHSPQPNLRKTYLFLSPSIHKKERNKKISRVFFHQIYYLNKPSSSTVMRMLEQ